MFRSATLHILSPFEARSPLAAFLCLSAGLGALLALAAAQVFGATAVPVLVFAVIVAISSFGIARHYEHRDLGLCNAVTLARAAMVAFLTGALFAPETSAWLVCVTATLAFALDGMDGWLARRSQLSSRFGARFDMETDAGLAAVVALWIWVAGIAGPAVLILGFMRYGFVLASCIWPALKAELPQAFRRKFICVIQISVLVALTFPITPQALVTPLVIGAIGLLVWSFAVDTLWLIRRAA